jgi:hypothetical protein
LQGRLWLRGLWRRRGHGGSGRVIRQVEHDSLCEDGKVRDRTICSANGREGVEREEARQQGGINESGPSIRVDMRGDRVACPRESGATFVYWGRRRRGRGFVSLGEGTAELAR